MDIPPIPEGSLPAEKFRQYKKYQLPLVKTELSYKRNGSTFDRAMYLFIYADLSFWFTD